MLFGSNTPRFKFSAFGGVKFELEGAKDLLAPHLELRISGARDRITSLNWPDLSDTPCTYILNRILQVLLDLPSCR